MNGVWSSSVLQTMGIGGRLGPDKGSDTVNDFLSFRKMITPTLI